MDSASGAGPLVFARIVERYVRLFPTQWGVFYKIWPGEGETVDYGAGM